MARGSQFVYFMRPIGMAGPIKIGCSLTPESRLGSLNVGSPFQLELLASAPGDTRDESRLHWRFRSDRSHGEWFLVSVDLLKLVDHVRLNGALPPLEAVPRKRGGRRLRNLEWRRVKTALGKRLNKAEVWGYGRFTQHEMRPANIQALRDKCWGAHRPPLSGEDLDQMEAYIAHLHSLPNGKYSEREQAARSAAEARWAEQRRVRQSAAA